MGRQQVLDSIKRLHETKKITVILVSHSMEDMAKYASSLVVMHKGEIALTGTPKEVFSKYEELSGLGLDVPGMCKVMNKIRALGFDVPEGVFGVDEAAEIIADIIRREKC